MIAECAGCGDPLFPYMERCKGCGADNPSFERAQPPPPDDVYTSDQGTEHGLFVLGLAGIVAGGNAVSFTKVVPIWQLWLGAFCALTGAAMLVAFRRLTVSDLTPSSKTALRLAMGTAAAIFGWVGWLTR